MSQAFQIPVAARRHPRPSAVLPCVDCGQPRGTNYPQCPSCYQAVEVFWLADWQALLDQEQIQPGSADELLLAQVVLVEFERQPWTVVDLAMSFVRCTACGCELGGGPHACSECAMAFGNALWSEVLAGRQGNVTTNEHALHIGRRVLRYPHRQSANATKGWRLTFPRVLTGWLPTTPEAQRMAAYIKQGRIAEVEAGLAEVDAAINGAGGIPSESPAR
ncbi:MAG TPA: hypothetical protein VFZ66_01410 [Herpetosiphonaceae bacterium]